MPVAARHLTHQELLAAAARLAMEYAGAIPSAEVVRCVDRCRAELAAAGLRQGLVEAAVDMARRRLAERIPAHAI